MEVRGERNRVQNLPERGDRVTSGQFNHVVGEVVRGGGRGFCGLVAVEHGPVLVQVFGGWVEFGLGAVREAF